MDDGCLDGCADGWFDFDGCFGLFGGSSSGRSSSYSTGYQSGRVAGTVADTVLDVVDSDEPKRSPESEKQHRCRGRGKPQRVTLWLTVRKERVDEVADMLVRYGRDELLLKTTLWLSLWSGFGWRRIAVVAHCYVGDEAKLRDLTTDLKQEYPDWIKS